MSDMRAIVISLLAITNGAIILASHGSGLDEPEQPEVLSTSSSEAQATQLMPSYRDSSHIFVTAQLRGQTIHFMIDTGSAHTILGGADADRLGMTPEGEVMLNSVGGETLLSVGPSATLEFGGGRTARDVPILISDKIGISILGMDGLRSAGFSSVRM